MRQAAVLDRRGSAGMGSSGPSVNYAVDTQRPTLAADGAIAIGNSELKAGDRASVTFTFSEPVTGFAADAASTPNASLSTPQAIDANGNPITDATAASAIWRATLTANADTESAHNTLSLNLAAISDAAGNRGQRVVAGAQYGVDTVAPVLASATVNGTQLLLGYTEGGTLDGAQMDLYAFSVSVDGADSPVSLQAVDAAAKTIALTLFDPVRQGQMVRIGYTDPTPGIGDTARALQDAAGNDAASVKDWPVTNLTADNLPPVLDSATVHGNLLLLGYRESTALHALHAPQREAFALLANGSAIAITAVAVDAAANTVALTLARVIAPGQALNLGYTAPAGDAALRDGAGNAAASFANQPPGGGMQLPSGKTQRGTHSARGADRAPRSSAPPAPPPSARMGKGSAIRTCLLSSRGRANAPSGGLRRCDAWATPTAIGCAPRLASHRRMGICATPGWTVNRFQGLRGQVPTPANGNSGKHSSTAAHTADTNGTNGTDGNHSPPDARKQWPQASG